MNTHFPVKGEIVRQWHVLDADGMVRVQLVGWGQETPDAITTELLRWLPKGNRALPKDAGPGKTAGDGATQPLRKP